MGRWAFLVCISHIVLYFAPSCCHLGFSWGPLGAILGSLGAILGPRGNILGSSWLSWGHLRALLGLLRANTKPSWRDLGPGPPLGHHGPARPHCEPSGKPFGCPFEAFSALFRGHLGVVWALSFDPFAASEHVLIILALLPTISKTTPNLKLSIPHILVGRGGDAKRLQ